MRKRTLTELLTRSYASWQAPGSRVIQLSSLVIDGIYAEVMKDFDAAAGRGAEAGGILLGRRTENEIVIDEFEPALCEYRFGPSFRLSNKDRAGLRETLERVRKDEALFIVGWYRSDNRQEFALSEDDHKLLNNELQRESDVILLIKPGRSQPYEVKLFVREKGRFQQAPQTTHFPFESFRDLAPPRPPMQRSNPTIDGSESFDSADDAQPAASASAARELEDAAPTPSVEPESELPPLQPTPPQEFEPRQLLAEQQPPERTHRKRTLVIGTLLLAAIGGTIYYAIISRSAPPASTQPGLEAPAPVVANPVVPTPPPVSASPPPAAPDSAVEVPHPKENTVVGKDTDRQVRTFLRKWVDAEKSTNIGDLTALYASQLSSYFTNRSVTRAGVRAARETDIAKYGKLIICDIRDINVKMLDSGAVAATFRKRWQTAGPNVSMGEEQDELTLVSDQGKWQIEAEKRLRLYRERNEYYAPASKAVR